MFMKKDILVWNLKTLESFERASKQQSMHATYTVLISDGSKFMTKF